MSAPHDVEAFLAVAAIVIVTPGPDTALTIRNGVLRGRRAGIYTAAGVAGGQFIWALATALGVGTLLSGSQPGLLVLRLVGAGYLTYLGVRALLQARSRRGGRPLTAHEANARARLTAPFAQGLISNLANPKMLVFFLSLLPQFAGHRGSVEALLGLGLCFCLMTFAWLCAYAVLVSAVGDFLRRDEVRRRVDALTGVVLIGLGARVATERI